MRIIISPAKKMNTDTDTLEVLGLPRFLARAEYLTAVLRGMSHQALKSLWRCSDAIAELNIQRLERMDLRRSLTPALLAYEGIQYRTWPQAFSPGRNFPTCRSTCGFCPGFTASCVPLTGSFPTAWRCRPSSLVQSFLLCISFGAPLWPTRWPPRPA